MNIQVMNIQDRDPLTDSPPDYNALVVDHFERPRNGGRLEPAEDVIEGSAGKASQGAMFTLTARVADSRISAVRYEVYGCPHCVAAGSWLSEQLIGATIEELRAWSWRAAAQELQVPAEKRGRLLILEDAVRALAEDWRRRT
jgi:NifU-like protein involved in Fe-S cluster formation